MSSPAGEVLLVERRDEIFVLTLNRPHARNAIDGTLARELAAALDEFESDPRLRVAVLAGAGRGFCAGMDLKAYINGETVHVGDRGFAGIATRPPAKPLLAAVEGFAIAGGLEIALSCDLIIAARDARFGIPEVKRGLVAAAGGLLRLPRRVPHQLAMEMALTGESISAERAERAGLVVKVVEPGEALAAALALAEAIVVNAPLAVAASKRIVEEQWGWGPEEAWERQAEISGAVFASDDAREGALAFAEKRPPAWRAA
jgi:enoyl-CoA hydratase